MDKVYKFSEFILDKKSITLYHQNSPVQLSSRAFEMLLYLVEKRGEIVEKDEILDKVWKDSFVEEANLPVHISALRRVLQEKKGESRFIRTISGRGYSFIAEVEEIEANKQINTPVLSSNPPKKKNFSIAILPFNFENSSEDNEYLANGITQSLISDLSTIQDLRVLAYSAVKPYKNSDLELQEIGFLLDADRILTGIITEYKGKWEISTELINAQDKSCLWATSQTFEADDIFEVKKQISSEIVEKLKLKLIGKSNKNKEISSEAQKLYYRGNFVLESRSNSDRVSETLNQSLVFFQEAIKIEPNYALAYIGIGKTYVSLFNHRILHRDIAYAEALKAAQMALHSNQNLSETYVLKGSIEVFFEINFREAEKSLDKAIELNPNNADAYNWKNIVRLSEGRFDEALNLIEKAINLDPTSIRFSDNLLRTLLLSRKYTQTIEIADESLEFNPNSPSPYIFKAMSYTLLNCFEPALEEIDKAIKLRNFPDIIFLKCYILGCFGYKNETETLLKSTLSSFKKPIIDNYDLAIVYSVLPNLDKAFEYLNKAFEEKSVGIIFLKIDQRLENLRKDQRFIDLLEKLNLL